jgi:hypothetical protein
MPYTAFGKPVGKVKLAFIMLCGIATAFFVLKQSNIDVPLAHQVTHLLDKII